MTGLPLLRWLLPLDGAWRGIPDMEPSAKKSPGCQPFYFLSSSVDTILLLHFLLPLYCLESTSTFSDILIRHSAAAVISPSREWVSSPVLLRRWEMRCHPVRAAVLYGGFVGQCDCAKKEKTRYCDDIDISLLDLICQYAVEACDANGCCCLWCISPSPGFDDTGLSGLPVFFAVNRPWPHATLFWRRSINSKVPPCRFGSQLVACRMGERLCSCATAGATSCYRHRLPNASIVSQRHWNISPARTWAPRSC
ncbi:hypothetical protein HDV57DRAFT_485112 [Trichoderma longibrachiatum]